MNATNEKQKQAPFPSGGIVTPGHVGALKGFFERLFTETEKSVTEDRGRQYDELSRTFLSVAVDRVNELEDEKKELASQVKQLRDENVEMVRRLTNIQDYSCAANEALARAEAKLDVFNKTKTKQLLEANNALMIEVEHLKKVIGGYKSHATKAKSRRRKR